MALHRPRNCLPRWADIRTAIDFATAPRKGIDAQVAANDAATERACQLAEQRARLMAS